MADPLNLTGSWNGTYSYPAGQGPATPFLAQISESGSGFSGVITEPDVFTGLVTMEAEASGHRHGRSVDFTKTYRTFSPGYDAPVDYVGQISADGLVITGVWSLLDMDGTFEMVRDGVAEEPAFADAEVEAELELTGPLKR